MSYTLYSIQHYANALFFFSSRRRHTSWPRDWSSDVCSSDLHQQGEDQQEHHADQPAPGLGLCWGQSHPATRTVVVAPQIARLMKKSMMLIMTIAVRTARPTATPTPRSEEHTPE